MKTRFLFALALLSPHFALAGETIVAVDPAAAARCLDVAKPRVEALLKSEDDAAEFRHEISAIRIDDDARFQYRKPYRYVATFHVFSRMESWGYTYNSIYRVELDSGSATGCAVRKAVQQASWACGGPDEVHCW